MQPLFGWILDLGWSGAMQDGLRHYALADYRHGFVLMLGFAAIALLGATRITETRCHNITLGESH